MSNKFVDVWHEDFHCFLCVSVTITRAHLDMTSEGPSWAKGFFQKKVLPIRLIRTLASLLGKVIIHKWGKPKISLIRTLPKEVLLEKSFTQLANVPFLKRSFHQNLDRHEHK